MQRKTINNEGEWVAVQKEYIAQGGKWNGLNHGIYKPMPPALTFPSNITLHDNGVMTWGYIPQHDIAETISNEAVYLEALEHVYDEVCRVAREAKETESAASGLNRIYDESLGHIRNICALAIQAARTGTGEVDRTQEAAEDEISYIGNTKLD